MKTKRLVLDAIFAAITVLLYCFVKFPLPMLFPAFLEFNFSMLPIILCLLLLSWKDAVVVAFLRIGFKLLLVNTGTMYVGEIADLTMSLIIILGVALTLRFTKNKYLLILSIILSWVFAGVLTNIFINIPLYIKINGFTLEQLVGMCSIIPGINTSNFMTLYILVAVIPFNALLSIVVSLLSVILYIRLDKFKLLDFENNSQE